MSDRHMSALYCDDIRMEVGNKQSLMGVYNGELLAASFPLALPKLCVSIRISTPFEKPFQDLKVKAFLGDQIINEIEIDAEALRPQPQRDSDLKGDDDLQRFSVIALAMAFSPLLIQHPLRLKVRAYSGEDILKGASLVIRGLTEDEKRAFGVPN